MRVSLFALGLALSVAACSVERSREPSVSAAPEVSAEPSAPPTRALPTRTEPAKAPVDVPALSGRVNDYADVLTPEQATEISELYESVEREIGSQMALLTVDSLNGVPIADYSLAVANTWGLGRRGVDDGVLITLAMSERSMRIEVGYGLEQVISDQVAQEVIRRMGAEFSAGKRFEGIKLGSMELVRRIRANKALVGMRKP